MGGAPRVDGGSRRHLGGERSAMIRALRERGRVDVRDPESVRAWTDALDLSEEELLRAVEAVGSSAHDIWRYVTEDE
jgi:hypothetical protein